MAPPLTYDKVPLVGAAKYGFMTDNDPGIGRYSTLLPKLFPPGYVNTAFKTLPVDNRKVQIGKTYRQVSF